MTDSQLHVISDEWSIKSQELAMNSVVEVPQNTRFHFIPRSIFSASPWMYPACGQQQLPVLIGLCALHIVGRCTFGLPRHQLDVVTGIAEARCTTLCLFWRSVRRQSHTELQSIGNKCTNLCPPCAPLVERSNKNTTVLYCIRVSFQIYFIYEIRV
jgi:hypothetical protein